MPVSIRRLAYLAAVATLPASAAGSQPGADSLTAPRLVVLPVIGSAPETGAQYGLTALRVFRRGPESTTRASSEQAYVIWTAKHQFKAWVQREIWTAANRWRVRGRVEYLDFPLPFYGIGGDTRKSAEEWYTSRGISMLGFAQRKLATSLYASAGYRFVHTTLSDLEAGGALAGRAIEGSAGGNV